MVKNPVAVFWGEFWQFGNSYWFRSRLRLRIGWDMWFPQHGSVSLSCPAFVTTWSVLRSFYIMLFLVDLWCTWFFGYCVLGFLCGGFRFCLLWCIHLEVSFEFKSGGAIIFSLTILRMMWNSGTWRVRIWLGRLWADFWGEFDNLVALI